MRARISLLFSGELSSAFWASRKLPSRACVWARAIQSGFFFSTEERDSSIASFQSLTARRYSSSATRTFARAT